MAYFKRYATARVQIRLGHYIAEIGDKLELSGVQNERGEEVKIKHNGRLYWVDPIELTLPLTAMPWIKKSKLKIRPQTLDA